MINRTVLRPWAFGTGIALASSGMVVAIGLFLAMLASMQIIQNRLPDSAALSILRLGQETEIAALHWRYFRTGPSAAQSEEAAANEKALLLAMDILISRVQTIHDGALYGYLDRQPDLRRMADLIQNKVEQLDASTRSGNLTEPERIADIDAQFDSLRRDTRLFVAQISKTRDDLIAQGLEELSVFRWLVGGAIVLAVGSALMLTIVVWRQNRRLVEEGQALLEAQREAELARTRTELAMRSRTRLFANTSHELRTPLNAIMGFSEIMATEALGKLGNERYRGYCQDIHGSALVLLELVDDLLMLGAIEEGKFDLTLDVVPLGPILERIRSMMGLKAQERGITLQFDVTPGLAVRGEARAIRQILINLIDNAIKYSPKGSMVSCQVGLDGGGMVRLVVEDGGPGIPPDRIAHLFQPFQRGEDAFVRQTKGAGLGLAIVRALATRMNTDISLTPASPHGLRAEFRLPRAAMPGAGLQEQPDAFGPDA